MHTQSRNVEISVNRMQKTNRALQIWKVGFNNKANTTVKVLVAGPGFKTRTIYNFSVESGESVNWRLDLYKSNNMSYAQVLKTAVNRKAAKAKTDGSINIKAGKVVADNESVTGTHMRRTVNKVLTGCNYRHGGHNIKVKCSKQPEKIIFSVKIGLPPCQLRK